MSDGGRFVYVFRYAEMLHKIGISNEPSARLAQLQAEDVRRLSIVRTWLRHDGSAPIIERQAHKILVHKREQGERFLVGPSVACAAVELAVALIEDTGDDLLPLRLLPSTRLAWDEADSVPVLLTLIGIGRGPDDMIRLRREGVAENAIYEDLTLALKAARRGDTLLLCNPVEGVEERATAKGISVRTLYRLFGLRGTPIFGGPKKRGDT